MAVADTLDALLDEVSGKTRREAYVHKMTHPVPDMPVYDRRAYILDKCKGKVVLNIGSASGALHEQIVAVAAKAYGLDREHTGLPRHIPFDLETCHTELIPFLPSVELVVMGEVLEHLANPGHVLKRLRDAYACPVLVTTPNAFSAIGFAALAKGIESVNRDHVAYYSYWTLRRLMERHGYTEQEAGWYNGKPKTAEGLVMLVRPDNSPREGLMPIG